MSSQLRNLFARTQASEETARSALFMLKPFVVLPSTKDRFDFDHPNLILAIVIAHTNEKNLEMSRLKKHPQNLAALLADARNIGLDETVLEEIAEQYDNLSAHDRASFVVKLLSPKKT